MAQKAAYSDVSLQSEVDTSRAVDEIIQRAGQAAKTIPLEAARMKAKPREIRKNRKVEAEKLRAEKRTGRAELSKAPPEVSSKPRSMSGLDAQFWQFAEEEEDD